MKTRYPRAAALEVARELCAVLIPACVPGRVIVAGSLRRRKEEVGDVEILFVPLHGMCNLPGELLPRHGNIAEAVIAVMEEGGILRRRLSKTGTESYGPKNKLMVHVASDIPVDLFTATEDNWFNYLVCRTGSAESNTRIAVAAQARGAKWNPYGPGFTDHGRVHAMSSERAVFEFVGLEYLEPWQR